MTTAYLSEIFSSKQGEGSHMGEMMTFIRFSGCSLSCRWCDTDITPKMKRLRVETPPQSTHFVDKENPLDVGELNAILRPFSDTIYSITGGEPLDQVAFLTTWLPTLRPQHVVLLETAGVHTAALKQVIDHIDIISMDIKLASSTGMTTKMRHHHDFLNTALDHPNIETYVKLVVTRGTNDDELSEACRMVGAIDPAIPFYLQPASSTPTFADIPTDDEIARWHKIASQSLTHVIVRPQMHKQWGVL